MRDVSRTFVATALIQAANLLSGIMLARILLAEGRGELAAAMLWPSTVAAIGIFAIQESVTYFASRGRGQEREIFLSAMVLGAGLSALAALAAVIVIEIALAGYRAEVIDAARYYILFIPLNYVGICCVGLFQGRLHLDEWNIMRTLVHVAYTCLIGLFYLSGWTSILAFVVASLAANVVMILFCLARMLRHGWFGPARPVFMREMFSFGAKAHAGGLTNTLSAQLDLLVLSVVGGGLALGLYVVANTVGRLVTVPGGTLSALAFTKVANAEGPAAKQDAFGRYLRASLILSVAAALIIAIAGEWIVALFFGQGFAGAVPLVPVLALASAFMGTKAVLAAGLKGLGQPLATAWAELAGLCVLAAGLAALVPAHGGMGAAVAMALGQAGGSVAMVWFGARATGAHLAGLFRFGARDLETFTSLLRRG